MEARERRAEGKKVEKGKEDFRLKVTCESHETRARRGEIKRVAEAPRLKQK